MKLYDLYNDKMSKWIIEVSNGYCYKKALQKSVETQKHPNQRKMVLVDKTSHKPKGKSNLNRHTRDLGGYLVPSVFSINHGK